MLLRQVMVAGRGPRPAVFASALTDRFGLGRVSLGETDQQWYSRAKAAVARYDDLVARAGRIAVAAVRNDLLEAYHRDPRDREGAWYRRDSVADDVGVAEASRPVNYDVFSLGRVRNRVEKLEAWDREFKEDVEGAERVYETLPEPIVRERTVELAPPAETVDWRLPALAGAGVLVAAFLSGLLG